MWVWCTLLAYNSIAWAHRQKQFPDSTIGTQFCKITVSDLMLFITRIPKRPLIAVHWNMFSYKDFDFVAQLLLYSILDTCVDE